MLVTMQASKGKKPSPAVIAAYETVLASAQLGESQGDDAVVQLSLPALNELLRLVGLPDIEEQGAPPAELDVGQEGAPAADSEVGEVALATPWCIGTIGEIVGLDGVAVISCPAVEEQFKKQVFVKIDDLRAEFHGDLSKHVGAEVMFPLNADEEDNLWAGPPVFAKTRRFVGSIKVWKANFGFIKCEELDALFADGVYMHGNAAFRGNVPTEVGQEVTFELHVSEKGKPQASSPRPVGIDSGAMSSENPAKRQKLFQQPVAKGGASWSASLGPGQWGGGMDHGGFKGKESFGKGGWKDGGKGGWKDGGKFSDFGWAKGGKWSGGKWSGGKAGKAGEEWYEGTITNYGKEKGFGFIHGSSFGEDVYVHTNVVESCGAYNGAWVQFKVHVSKQGKPQASSPMYVV